jgi:hypothetical protein
VVSISPSKEKPITTIYKLDYDHDWGTRGTRRISSFYVSIKMNEEKCKEYLIRKLQLDPEYYCPSAVTISKIKLNKEVQTVEYV